jgi:hypothetical protein
MTNEFDLGKVVSDEYRKLLEHETKRPWGGAVIGSQKRIHDWAKLHGCNSILDYGSGKSDFLISINQDFPDHGFQINQYEPARPEFSMDPPVSDMTICVDVLEHIEPEKLDAVLDHIYQKTNKIFYFKVCLLPAQGTLADGRNLHLIIEDKEFWLDKLSKYYTLEDIVFTRGHVWGLGIKK